MLKNFVVALLQTVRYALQTVILLLKTLVFALLQAMRYVLQAVVSLLDGLSTAVSPR